MDEPKPLRIQCRRVKGFNLQAMSQARNGLPCVYVGRPSRWGNPHEPSPTERFDAYNRFVAVEDYKEHLEEHPELVVLAKQELRGKNLACYCKEGEACHADILLQIANEDPIEP